MEMVKGLCRECLSGVVVATRRQIDVLAISGLLLMKSFIEKKLNRTAKVLLPQTILLKGYHRRINRLREVILDNLLLGRLCTGLRACS